MDAHVLVELVLWSLTAAGSMAWLARARAGAERIAGPLPARAPRS